jgi:hypothetical protein
MFVVLPRRVLGGAVVANFNRGKMDWFRRLAQEKKIVLVIASRYWHNAAKSWMDGAD